MRRRKERKERGEKSCVRKGERVTNIDDCKQDNTALGRHRVLYLTTVSGQGVEWEGVDETEVSVSARSRDHLLPYCRHLELHPPPERTSLKTSLKVQCYQASKSHR